MQTHYEGDKGAEYFSLKRDEFLSNEWGALKAAKFNPYLRPEWRLVDFGCSSAYVTKHLICKDKIGIEINPAAIAVARDQFGIDTVPDFSSLEKASYDAVVSHHALEHVEQPIDVLRGAHSVLKPGGLMIFVVPGESGWFPRYNHWREEPDKHLFSWTPLTLGNLFVAAGFEVVEARSLPILYRSRFLGPLNNLPGSGQLMGKLRKHVVGEAETMVIARKASR